MKLNMFLGILRIACVVSAMLPTLVHAQTDTVTKWNSLMQSTVGAAPTNANFQARWGAIVQLAVFEAVNSITGEYEPYTGIPKGPAWASLDAAAATASHRSLVALRPSSATLLDNELAISLDSIADGPEKEAGILVGENAAAAAAIPNELEAIICRAMETNPQARYATAAEFADDLRRFLDGQPVAAKSLPNHYRHIAKPHGAIHPMSSLRDFRSCWGCLPGVYTPGFPIPRLRR